MARKPHLAMMSDDFLDEYFRQINLELAAVIAERLIRDGEEWKRRVRLDRQLAIAPSDDDRAAS